MTRFVVDERPVLKALYQGTASAGPSEHVKC
jgi:hypothetical protein